MKNKSLFRESVGVCFHPKLSKFRVGVQIGAWTGVALKASPAHFLFGSLLYFLGVLKKC
jgi:hypothetical protein